MKKIVSALLLICCVTVLSAQNLKTIIDYQIFATKELQPYLEMTFIITGGTPTYIKTEEGYTSEVLITVSLQEKNSRQWVDTFTYLLYSVPNQELSLAQNDYGNIYREVIDTGEYILHFKIEDLHDSTKTVHYSDLISARFPLDKVSVSEINLLSSFAVAQPDDFFEKYGYNLAPKYNNFYPKEITDFQFFLEVYNLNSFFHDDEKVKIKSFIKSSNNRLLDLSHLTREILYAPDPVVVILQKFDIHALPSGNYHLGIEIYDINGKVKTSTYCMFQRSNPVVDSLFFGGQAEQSVIGTFAESMNDIIELQEHISSMYPIADPVERRFIRFQIEDLKIEELQKFFYSFWYKRAPENPELAWLAYVEQVKHVNKEFGSKLVKGHRTDRGRIYLQYGPPNSIREAPYSPTTHPYQIWHYYEIDGETNVRFVLYTTDFVSNDYKLLHSNKRGEVTENAWQIVLMKGYLPRSDFDLTKPEDFYGNDMDDNWNNP